MQVFWITVIVVDDKRPWSWPTEGTDTTRASVKYQDIIYVSQEAS